MQRNVDREIRAVSHRSAGEPVSTFPPAYRQSSLSCLISILIIISSEPMLLACLNRVGDLVPDVTVDKTVDDCPLRPAGGS